MEHLGTVEASIAEVESELQGLSETAPEVVTALETKRDSLVDKETQIEEVLSNNEKFLITESALKKDELYESVSPDFIESPPLQYIKMSPSTQEDLLVGDEALLQYILRARTSDADTATGTNWDVADETAGSKEE